MGQGRGREDATADSSVGAKGPDCVDMQKGENQRRNGEVRDETERERDFKPEGACVCLLMGRRGGKADINKKW